MDSYNNRITDRLIPLFAIGAFLTFTLSQTGMVVHWMRELRKAADSRTRTHHRAHLAVNAIGALTTAVALLIIIGAKFVEGAWITIVAIPLVILLLMSIRRYYDELDTSLRPAGPIRVDSIDPPVVLVVIERWNKLAERGLSFAMRLSPDVMAVHVTRLKGDEDDSDVGIWERWVADVERPSTRIGLRPPRLMLIRSEYRLMYAPLLALVRELEKEFAGRTIAVLLPQVVKTNWWQFLLHTHRARRLRAKLLRFGGDNLALVSVPFYLEEPKPDEAINNETEDARTVVAETVA